MGLSENGYGWRGKQHRFFWGWEYKRLEGDGTCRVLQLGEFGWFHRVRFLNELGHFSLTHIQLRPRSKSILFSWSQKCVPEKTDCSDVAATRERAWVFWIGAHMWWAWLVASNKKQACSSRALWWIVMSAGCM